MTAASLSEFFVVLDSDPYHILLRVCYVFRSLELTWLLFLSFAIRERQAMFLLRKFSFWLVIFSLHLLCW